MVDVSKVDTTVRLLGESPCQVVLPRSICAVTVHKYRLNHAHDGLVCVPGKEIAYPVLVAPMAMQRLAHPDGELATSRAAAAEGIPMVCCSSDTQHS